MSNLTFRQYLVELVVSDDPIKAREEIKSAARNPEQYNRKQNAQNVDDQRTVQQDDADPNKSEKLRILKMQQQVAMNKKRLAAKEKQAARNAGVDQEGQV